MSEQSEREVLGHMSMDDFVFTWFNDLYPDEMARCLASYDERHSAAAIAKTMESE